jgi:ATP phosphoribosyltransferase
MGLVNFGERKLRLETNYSPATVICVRSTDIPLLLADGTIHIGITGNDYVMESGVDVVDLVDLEFCAGSLCVLVDEADPAQSLQDLPPDVVLATQYPMCTKRLIQPHFPRSVMRVIDGAAEVYPSLGLCRAIVDVVNTGNTANSNHLRVLASVLNTSGRLFASRTIPSSLMADVGELVRRFRADGGLESAPTSARTGQALAMRTLPPQ